VTTPPARICWKGKPFDEMTKVELRKALAEAVTIITILSGEIAKAMGACECASCIGDDASAYMDSLGGRN
jgi:hypothetical protein